jgi:GPH family glycoside/pentoside/hexuronide:cation symporter
MLIGVGLAGLILMGDAIMADVVDEDHVKTGERRAGMYFGMSSLMTTLSSALASLIFGWLLPMYGYKTPPWTCSPLPWGLVSGFS